MKKIYGIESIEELTEFLKTIEKPEINKFLENEFRYLTEYKDADEWNKLVKVCECLSILGWEKLERVDAICVKIANSWKTELRNKEKELRFLTANWTKRKNGFIYLNPCYYFSPDIPEKKSVDWQDYPKREVKEVNVPKLLDQRNKQKTNPIVIGGIYQLKSKIKREMLFPLLKDLNKILNKALNADMYGSGIDIIAVRYVTAETAKSNTRFVKGTYYPQKSEYNTEIIFGEEYAASSIMERKEIIKQILLQTLEDVKLKVNKHKLNYNIDLLINEVNKEASEWVQHI